jgi:hypothetical protein
MQIDSSATTNTTTTNVSKENEKRKEKDKNKESKDSRVKKVNIYSIANEIRLLNSCQHKNIVKHIGSYMWKDQIWVHIFFFSFID